MSDKNLYQTGFGNHFATEALANTLPQGQNSPQRVAHGLYTEQLSGTAFTVPRRYNQRSWLYRIRPSVVHGDFHIYNDHQLETTGNTVIPPNQMRWDPLPIPEKPTDFVHGLIPFVFNGSPKNFTGSLIYLYACNQSMTDRYFYNSDGEMLFVPQLGSMKLHTEFGVVTIEPQEIAVIPRGVKFRVELLDTSARGYVCENHGAPLGLPDLGPIGANGLANPRDFLYPCASFEDREEKFTLLCKFQNQLWQAKLHHSPLDVVAWHGNYAPYKYDLRLFNTMNTVSYDHPDPSIFTVLTSQTNTPGVANLDFVIFPSRWMVAEKTFRPPYYHRNIMSEFMGLICGNYDAKGENFEPGGSSLHNCMQPHGPDSDAFEQASHADLNPEYYKETLAFMFESHQVWEPSAFAIETPLRQTDYINCWQSLKKHFKG